MFYLEFSAFSNGIYFRKHFPDTVYNKTGRYWSDSSESWGLWVVVIDCLRCEEEVPKPGGGVAKRGAAARAWGLCVARDLNARRSLLLRPVTILP